MYNMRLNEDYYQFVAPVRRLNKYRVGQRVIYSGRTNYTYHEGGYRCEAIKEKGTVVQKSELNIVIELDNYRHPYRTKPSVLGGGEVEVFPPKQIAVVSECDLACGDKKVDIINE